MIRMLTNFHRQMVDDGLPETAIIPPDERKDAWKGVKLKTTKALGGKPPAKEIDPGTAKLLAEREAKAKADAKAKKAAKKEAAIIKARQRAKPAADAATQETTMAKTAKKTSKAAQVAKLRTDRAAKKGAAKPAGGARAKKSATAKARTPAAAKPASGAPKAIRPGSKLELVVGLLTRKEGCTAADILAATEWPAVSVPQQAKAAGLTLRKEKDGKVSRYWGTAA